MLECNGELVNVSKATLDSQAFLWRRLPHVGCVVCLVGLFGAGVFLRRPGQRRRGTLARRVCRRLSVFSRVARM